jgi:Variant SH3 domain
MTGPRRVRVTRDHAPVERDPLRLRPGDTVEVGRRDDTWTEFLWCANEVGEGWVHESYLSIDGAAATATREYETTELAAVRGERLTVLEEAGGWLYCRTAAGWQGWIPVENVDAR